MENFASGLMFGFIRLYMLKFFQNIHPIFVLVIATSLEAYGDSLIRKSIYQYTGIARLGLMLVGAVLLFGYGYFLNLAPVAFEKIVGLYIATLFVVWQIVTYLNFRTIPSLPIIVGGTLIVMGGLIVTFWRAGEA